MREMGRTVATALAQRGRAQPSRRRRLAGMRAVETSRIMARFLAVLPGACKSFADVVYRSGSAPLNRSR